MSMRKEHDFSKGVRGKYSDRLSEGIRLVVLAPDVAKAFPTSDEVNAALRALAVEREKADVNPGGRLAQRVHRTSPVALRRVSPPLSRSEAATTSTAARTSRWYVSSKSSARKTRGRSRRRAEDANGLLVSRFGGINLEAAYVRRAFEDGQVSVSRGAEMLRPRSDRDTRSPLRGDRASRVR